MQNERTFVYPNAALDRRFGGDEAQRAEAVGALNILLATLIDLRAQAKQVHWNVRGPLFHELHKLFDEAAESVDGFIDRVAERAAALDGVVRGALRDVLDASALENYPLEAHKWRGISHVRFLCIQFERAAKLANRVVREASERGDEGTNTLVGEVVEALDKTHWMLRATAQRERT